MESGRGLFALPPIVKYLLIINGALFIIVHIAGVNLFPQLAIYSFKSDLFKPVQLLSHMFMHGSFAHLFFNMFALWMFGRVLEQVWGSQKFFMYYFICGIGAAILHLFVMQMEINSLIRTMDPQLVDQVLAEGSTILQQGKNYINPQMRDLNLMVNTPTVGASGAIYGLLLAFGMLFPNSLIYLYFAIPIKAKYFVMIFAAIELYLGFARTGSNIAHFAHLGGMLFGLILILLWRQKKYDRWD